MKFTTRTNFSFAQFIYLQDVNIIKTLLEKHSLPSNYTGIENIKEYFDKYNTDFLVDEIISTLATLRKNISPKYPFDERFKDLEKCLLLDGYKVENNSLIKIEPSTDGIIPIEDDLTKEIMKSSLLHKQDIIDSIDTSARAFKDKTPDYNECLIKVRLAIETIIKDIAHSYGIDDKWGKSLNELCKKDFLKKDEEEAIATTYTFISPSAHRHIGFTEEEYARYGRNLILSACYFIIKKFNNIKPSDNNLFEKF